MVMKARTVSILGLVFLLVSGAFIGGMWTTHKNWPAWRTMDQTTALWRSWRATGRVLRDMTFVHRTKYAADAPYTAADPALLAKGSLLISRFDPDSQLPVAELVAADGSVQHRWPIDYARLVPGGPKDEFPHATTLLADGSLMVNFDDGRAVARIDACGDPVWVKGDMVYHHVISRGFDGYWVWADPSWDGGHNQFLIRIDPDSGETLEKISLLDDVIPATKGGGALFTMPEGFPVRLEADPDQDKDILHPNDVEELLPEMAAAFPMFRAGDLLISMRNINLVAVIDRQSHAVKWAQYGPWRDQHDPDFEPDGTISVLSNNLDRNRSTLFAVDPATKTWRDLYAGTDFWFNTYIMGKHQRLPNGNRLIASSMEGRVIEVTAAGKIVREFNNMIDDNYNSILSSAEFVPDGYLSALPACTK